MIDWNLLLHFIMGLLTAFTIIGGIAMYRFSEYEDEIKRLRRRLAHHEDEWIRRDRMQTWGREE